MYTDSWFLVGSDDAVRLQAQYSKEPVYYYLFGHRGVISFSFIFGDPEKDYGTHFVLRGFLNRYTSNFVLQEYAT